MLILVSSFSIFTVCYASLDTIKNQIKFDSIYYSLDAILEYAQMYPVYKGSLKYQEIVDLYYQSNPHLVEAARQAACDAGRNISLDSNSFISSGMQNFLKAYRKLPTGKQDIILSPKVGAIVLDGRSTSNAKTIVDWMKQNKIKLYNLAAKFPADQAVLDLLVLLDE